MGNGEINKSVSDLRDTPQILLGVINQLKSQKEINLVRKEMEAEVLPAHRKHIPIDFLKSHAEERKDPGNKINQSDLEINPQKMHI